MQFSKDIRHYSSTPRSLSSSKFGPYARLSVSDKQRRFNLVMDAACCIAAGIFIGIVWYVLVGLRA